MSRVGKPYGRWPVVLPQIITDKFHRHETSEIDIYFFYCEEISEPEVCSDFGCGKRLSLQERLFGNKCIRHQEVKSIDPGEFISV